MSWYTDDDDVMSHIKELLMFCSNILFTVNLLHMQVIDVFSFMLKHALIIDWLGDCCKAS